MLRILVVDDDAELNGSVCKFLEMNGYEVVGCLDAPVAYDAMYGSSFDCIISDIMMPKIDGYELAETVRGLDSNIPILFMTAKGDIASKQKGYRAGIDDYMVKPVVLSRWWRHRMRRCPLSERSLQKSIPDCTQELSARLKSHAATRYGT